MPVDHSFSDLPLYALPLSAALGLLAIPRSLSTDKRVRAWFASMHRATGDLRPGPGHFEVETIGEAPTNFGHSSESKSPRATPTLQTEAHVLQIVGGPRTRITPGVKMSVHSFAGATRRHLDAVTTAEGIKSAFSFDVPPGTRFFIRGHLAPAPGGDYRADATLDLTPILNTEYEVTRAPFRPPAVQSQLVLFGLISFIIGIFVGLFATMMWRTGCASGKHSVPNAAFIDSGCIAAVISAIGLHVGIKQLPPTQMRAMEEEQQGPR